MRHEQIPNKKIENPALPFDVEYEAERQKIAKEHGVDVGVVDKRSDGNWYVNGKRILPADTFFGREPDDDAQYYWDRNKKH